MKRIDIMSKYELSYEELKGLESHFKKIQDDAVVDNLKKSSQMAISMVLKMISELKKSEELAATSSHKKRLDTENMRWV